MAERRRVPEFKTLDEMARFWDEHDITKFAHEGPEDVTYRPKRVVLSVRFDFEDFVELSRQARRMGVDRSTLVRMIVKRALHGSGDEAADPDREWRRLQGQGAAVRDVPPHPAG